VLRDLKYYKKLKTDGKCTSLMKGCTAETINLEVDPDFIDNEEFSGHKLRTMNSSLMFLSKQSKIEQFHVEQETSPFEAKNEAGNNSKENIVVPLISTRSNWVKGISLIERVDKQLTSIAVPQNEVETEKPNSSAGKTCNRFLINQVDRNKEK
jgi:hypothetical protein